MSEMLNMLQNAVAGRSPIVYVFSPEEERILRGIREIAAPNGTPVITWSCVRGLDGEDAATQNPVEAIKTIMQKCFILLVFIISDNRILFEIFPFFIMALLYRNLFLNVQNHDYQVSCYYLQTNHYMFHPSPNSYDSS